MITFGNLSGNTFDALLSRLCGGPAEGSGLGSELATLVLLVLGTPLLALRGGDDDMALEHPERQTHGTEYEAYCARTGRYLPRLRLTEKE